jgi:hypothetical protein
MVFGKNPIKLPSRGGAKRMIMQANVHAAEAYYDYVFLITHTYNRLLAYIGNHNLQMDEPNRKACIKDLDKTIIPEMTLVRDELKGATGSGNIIPNGLLLAAEEALVLAAEMKLVCKKGNFGEKGWAEKLKMFEHFEKAIDKEVQRIARVFHEGTHPAARSEVLTDLARLYINPCNDLKDHARMGAHQ